MDNFMPYHYLLTFQKCIPVPGSALELLLSPKTGELVLSCPHPCCLCEILVEEVLLFVT